MDRDRGKEREGEREREKAKGAVNPHQGTELEDRPRGQATMAKTRRDADGEKEKGVEGGGGELDYFKTRLR